MNNSLILALLACVTLSIYSCGSGSQAEGEEPLTEEELATQEGFGNEGAAINADTTSAVLQRHLDAFGANDIDAMVADYADDATIKTPDSTYTGTAQITALYTGLFQAFPTGGTEFVLDTTIIDVEIAYIEWKAKSAAMNVTFGADSFIVADGKIQYQSVQLEIEEPATEEGAAEEVTEDEAEG